MTLFEAGTPEKAGIRDSSSRQNQLNRNRNVARLGASVLLASAALVPISDAAAQEPKMDEIVVTARKRVESLQDIPIAITAFSADAIEKRGIDSMADIARLSTSLVFETAFTPQDTRPVIRGLSATRGRQPVGILLDGIDVSSESLLTGGGGIGVNLNLVDVERIEVVKGPQSALYGRVAFGGAINYISRKPSDEFEARLGGDFGNYGQAMVSGSVSGPVIDDVLAVRVNGAYSNHDGFYENEISGDDIGDFESIGGAIALRFTPSEALTIDGRVSYSEDEAGPAAQYYVGSANGGTFSQPFPSEAQPLVDAGVFPATINLTAPGGRLEPAGPIQLSLNPLTGEDYRGSLTEALYSSVLIEYDFGNNISLNTWTGYSEVDGDYHVDTDFFGLPAVQVAFPTPGGLGEPLGNSFVSKATTLAQQFNQEIRIGDLVSDGFRWAVGGLYWREDYDMDAQNLITVVVAPPGQGSADLNTRLANPTTSQATFRNTEHWSVYGTLEFDLSDRLTASIEGRYSEESFDYQWFAGGTVAVSVFGPAGGITGPGEQFNASADESFFAPAFSLDYTINDDAMVYARIAKGVKPGGFSTVAAPRVENARYTEETLWNYEIGLKSTWLDNRVVFNSSIFYMDYGDKQFQTLIPDADSGRHAA
jgi:iron complex outermembrane receptor protein